MRRLFCVSSVLCASLACGIALGEELNPSAKPDTGAVVSTGADPSQIQRIRDILDDGFHVGPKGLMEAESHVRAASQAQDREPRIEYAHGLVLLKHLKYREAIHAFQAATAKQGDAYLPAWQLMIETQLRIRDYDGGLREAETLAKLLRNSSTTWSPPHEQTEAAYWLGRVIAACMLAEVDPSESPRPEFLDVLFRRFFDAELEFAYLAGRKSVADEYQSYVEKLDETKTESAQKKQEMQKKLDAEMKLRQRDFKEQSATVARSAKEWEAWLKEQLERNKSDLDQIEKDQKVLQPAIASTSQALAALQIEISRLRSEISSQNAQTQDIRYQAQLVPLEYQASQFQAQLGALSVQADELNTKAQTLVTQRNTAIQAYQSGTGKLLKQDEQLEKWKKSLDRENEKMSEKAGKVAPQVRVQKKRLTQLSTYLDFDINSEKQRLLEELANAG